MSVVVTLLFVAVTAMALLTNRDLFSPAKFFLFSFFLFHVGAFDNDHALEVWLLLVLVLFVGIAASLFEVLNVPVRARSVTGPGKPVDKESGRYFKALWMLSIPAVLAQAFMIQNFGGIEGYIGSLALRVVEWRGLGWAKTLIATIAIVNVAYFAVGLTRPRSNRWWVGYALHFVIVLTLGVLSGSRSGMLNVFAMQLLTYHYVKREVRLRAAITVTVALVLSGLVLGVVRDGFKLEEGELTTGLTDAEQVFSIPTLKYGVTPLDILVDAGPLQLAYGSTLVSLFTNAIPRDLLPDKPDTGGVFFTKNYTGDEWDGASNLTPTLLGEFVINFGWFIGVPVYVIVYVLLMYAVVRFYRRTRARLQAAPGCSSALQFVVYLQCMWSVVALMTGEVTNVVLTTALTGLLPTFAAIVLASPRPSRRAVLRPRQLAG